MKEKLNFKFKLTSEYWDLPPKLDILIDNKLQWSGPILEKQKTVDFWVDLEVGKSYHLAVHRFNKLDGQCKVLNNGSRQDQYVIIDQLIIDNVDIQIWKPQVFDSEHLFQVIK